MSALCRGNAVANGDKRRRNDHREGPLDARTLRARVGARLWGPGRFGPALRRVVRDGRVRRVGRRTWAAVD